MRDINIAGGNVTINIFDGCTIETIRINGGAHTHNYGQSPETLKVPCSQEFVDVLNIIARVLKGEKVGVVRQQSSTAENDKEKEGKNDIGISDGA